VAFLRCCRQANAWRVRAAALALAPVLAGSGLAACGGAYVSGPSVTTTASFTNGTVDERYVSGYGHVLVTSAGYSLYLLTSDPPGSSSCVGPCTVAWPPLLAKGRLKAGPGVNPQLLSSFVRPGGTRQVLYDDHALYTYEGDTAPGMLAGEGIETYGGTWWAVSPKGDAVKS